MPFLFIACCGTVACVSQEMDNFAPDAIETRAADGIAHCRTEYLKRTRKPSFPTGANRAYVLVYQEQVDILFTDGAIGAYEERNKTYRSYLYCSILGKGNPKIAVLAPTQADVLIDDEVTPEILDLGGEKGPITNLIFLKKNKVFRFWKKFEYETIGDYKEMSG